jgi:diketogulonate reductase-like aldo/keto reductase
MAYSPVDQGGLIAHPVLRKIGAKHGDASAAQVAIAWLLRQDGVVVIPKAGRGEHVRENRDALDLVLDRDDLTALDAAFPPPKREKPLEMI